MTTISRHFALIATAMVAAAIALPTTAQAEPTPPCASGHVQVSNGGQQAASGHREVTLTFSLAPEAAPCTLTGYPGVDSGAGGPMLHADRTLSGFMGGLRVGTPPTVTLLPGQPVYAVVEGVAADRIDVYRKCPTYTDLQVTPPDTTETVTVPAKIETCELQIHPVGSE